MSPAAMLARRRWMTLAFSTIALIGCSRLGHDPDIEVVKSTADLPLIDEKSKGHHFGAVISSPDRKLVHRYRLANSTNHKIRIVDLVNRKPCCGEILVGKSLLLPKDETEVEVKLSIRQEFGAVTHEVVILTDPPQTEDLVLRTTAETYPAIQVDDAAGINGSALLSTDQTKLVPRPD